VNARVCTFIHSVVVIVVVIAVIGTSSTIESEVDFDVGTIVRARILL
jgi:hypothetical protein